MTWFSELPEDRFVEILKSTDLIEGAEWFPIQQQLQVFYATLQFVFERIEALEAAVGITEHAERKAAFLEETS